MQLQCVECLKSHLMLVFVQICIKVIGTSYTARTTSRQIKLCPMYCTLSTYLINSVHYWHTERISQILIKIYSTHVVYFRHASWDILPISISTWSFSMQTHLYLAMSHATAELVVQHVSKHALAISLCIITHVKSPISSSISAGYIYKLSTLELQCCSIFTNQL